MGYIFGSTFSSSEDCNKFKILRTLVKLGKKEGKLNKQKNLCAKIFSAKMKNYQKISLSLEHCSSKCAVDFFFEIFEMFQMFQI